MGLSKMGGPSVQNAGAGVHGALQRSTSAVTQPLRQAARRRTIRGNTAAKTPQPAALRLRL